MQVTWTFLLSCFHPPPQLYVEISVFFFYFQFHFIVSHFRNQAMLVYVFVPGCVLLQQQLDKLSGNVERQDAFGHLLQHAQVVSISGGEAVHPGHGASKHWSKHKPDWGFPEVWKTRLHLLLLCKHSQSCPTSLCGISITEVNRWGD